MKEKILIVDDSEDIRILLRRILQAAGYEVAEAANGESALDEVAGLRPDLVLLDIVMPGVSGYEVCETLKRTDAVADVPVIFLSARSDAADKIKGLEIGGSDYITKPFDKGEVLARVENQLKIRRLTKELVRTNVDLVDKQKRLDDDLKAAAGIQQSLLPQKMPDIKNLTIAWKFMPSYMIGGDIFNVFRLDESHIGIYMIDVSGHGVPSALVTVSVSQTLRPDSGSVAKKKISRSPGYKIISPKEVLQTLDREYPIERFDKYFTIVYLIIDTGTGDLVYSNAAHPSPVIMRSDGSSVYLDKGGTIIGLGTIVPFEEEQISLEKGDKIILYTDGIAEYQNNNGEYFGEDRLYSILNGSRDEGVEALLDNVLHAITDFGKGREFQDDITLIAIEFKGAAG
jgi:sigma-B regulation protein RsbU (phosphoserine phosphatase)